MTPRTAYLISTFGGVGRAPKAPGTFGTLAAMPAGWIIGQLAGPVGLVIAAAIVFVAGMKAVEAYCTNEGKEDPGEVVIDEVCGIWLAMACLPFNASGMIVAFLMFRAFDIIKPWPVCWADRKVKGGLGVMLDDALAGIYPYIALSLVNLVHRTAGYGVWDWYGTLAVLP